jgi:hypothetical protein
VKQLDPSCDISFGLERVIYLVTRCGIGQQHLLSPATLISWRRQAEASTFSVHKDTAEEESTAEGSAIKPDLCQIRAAAKAEELISHSTNLGVNSVYKCST